MTQLSPGRFRFLGLSSLVRPSRWNMFSLWYVFASLRVRCRLPVWRRERELGRECRFQARSPWANTLSLVGNPGGRFPRFPLRPRKPPDLAGSLTLIATWGSNKGEHG